MAAVRELHGAFLAADVERFLDFLKPDVTWAPGAFFTGRSEYLGHDGVRQWLRDLRAVRAQGKIVITHHEEYVDAGSRVVVLGRGKIDPACGEVLERELGWVYRLEAGLVASLRTHIGHAAALASVGMRRLSATTPAPAPVPAPATRRARRLLSAR